MRLLDVGGLVALLAATLRCVLSVTGGRAATWRSGRRWSTATTALLAGAAVAGGVVSPRDTLIIVALVYGWGWAWARAAPRLPVAVDPTVAQATGTLLGAGLLLQARLLQGLGPTPALAAAGTAVAVAAAVGWRRMERAAGHGTGILLAGLSLYSLAALLSAGRLAAVPVPGGRVQVGDLARLLVLVGTAIVVANQPLRMSAVRDGASGLAGAVPALVAIGPIAVAWATVLALAALTRDFGGAALLFIELVAVLAACTGRLWPILIAIPSLAASTIAANTLTGHIAGRLQTWLHPGQLPPGHQHVQAMSAWTSGGWWGLGWGGGHPTSVPAVASDYILAGVGEELGVVGCFSLVVLVGVVVTAALRVAVRGDGQSAMVAAALAVFLGLQAVVVVLGSTGALPLTGVPFPWLSHGGAALTVNTLVAGAVTALTGSARGPAHPPHGFTRLAPASTLDR
jgi:cell division protein FtsW (lipid II flippase)